MPFSNFETVCMINDEVRTQTEAPGLHSSVCVSLTFTSNHIVYSEFHSSLGHHQMWMPKFGAVNKSRRSPPEFLGHYHIPMAVPSLSLH
jgi:hypothetical protein